MKMLLESLYALVLATGAVATDCNADNVLRALRNTKYGGGPSSFCSHYIGFTTTVSATVTTTSFITSSTTLPDVAVTDTITLTITDTVTTTSVSTLPDPTETDTATSTTVTTVTTQIVARDVGAAAARGLRRRSSVLSPGEPTELATYPPSRISSACTCLLSTVPTTTVTVTVTHSSSTTSTKTAQPTATDTFTSTTLTTTSVVTTETSTGPPVSTVTTTTTTVVSSTSTVAETPTTCSGLPNPYTVNGKTFQVNCNSFYILNVGRISDTYLNTFPECVLSCTQDSTCVGLDYDPVGKDCALFNSANPTTALTSGYQSARLIST